MMTHPDSPSGVRPGKERRQAVRVRPGPLRVRLHRTCEGILIDISETGALVQLPSAQSASKPITLQIEWQGAVMLLPARVVRSSPFRLELPTATLARREYQVAVEFEGLAPEAVSSVQEIVRQHPEA